MSSTASGRLKKYEPLDTRDFVSFEEYDELTVENIKEACEKFYNAPPGSCDILASDRGPSCTKLEQIKGRKVYFIRFLPPQEVERFDHEQPQVRARSAPVSPSKRASGSGNVVFPNTVYPKSVSITHLLRAGKLVKEPKTTSLQVELFDVDKCKWMRGATLDFMIEDEPFSSGAFRDAFKPTCNDHLHLGDWVVKKYKPTSNETIKEVLKSTVEDHTRKQVQMHAVARNITRRFSSKVPAEFGDSFQYGKVFYSVLDDLPITVEEFVPGEFRKYVNNNGACLTSPGDACDEVFAKAQCLVHYSYVFTEQKIMLVDLQGSMFQLYDPEIATTELTSKNSDEFYFCAGNLSQVTINEFKKEHKCNRYCVMMDIEDQF